MIRYLGVVTLACALAGCESGKRREEERRQHIAQLQDELTKERAAADAATAETERLRGELERKEAELVAARGQGEKSSAAADEMRGLAADLEAKLLEAEQTARKAVLESARLRAAAEAAVAVATDKGSGESAPPVEVAKPNTVVTPVVTPEESIPRAVVLIEGDRGSGTGFLVADDKHVYLYTAAHVLSGNERLTVKTNDGVVLRKFAGLEAAEGADLVRLGVLDVVKPDLPLRLVPPDTEVPVGTRVVAWGNGGGNGVVAPEQGKVLGTSDESIEVDAAIIQGNSGGPVVLAGDGRVLGLVTHLTVAREDIWAAGTRHAQVRRFACRLDREWVWKSLPVTTFLQDARKIERFDRVTRLGFAIGSLMATESGLRLNTDLPGGATIAGIIEENKDERVVKDLIAMNQWLGEKKTRTSENDLNKTLRRVIDASLAECSNPAGAMDPSKMAWFHRRDAETSVAWRAKAVAMLKERSDGLR